MQKPKFTPTDAPSVTTHAAPIPDALRNFDQLPDSANVRLPVVAALYACSAATIWRKVKAKSIPAPRKFGDKLTAWNVGELRKNLSNPGA